MLGALSEQVRVACLVFVALLLTPLFVGVSPLGESDTSWIIADTLVVSVVNWSWHNLLVVAGPSRVAISSWVVGIVELAGTGVHVSGALSEEERGTFWIGFALGLAELFALVSPHSDSASSWRVAETLRSLPCDSDIWGNLSIIAGPATVSIGNWVVHVVKLAGTGVHVSVALSEEVGAAAMSSTALILAPSFVGVSPHTQLGTSWSFAKTLVLNEVIGNNSRHQKRKFLHLKKYL